MTSPFGHRVVDVRAIHATFARFDDHAWRIYQDMDYAMVYLGRAVSLRGNFWRYFP